MAREIVATVQAYDIQERAEYAAHLRGDECAKTAARALADAAWRRQAALQAAICNLEAASLTDALAQAIHLVDVADSYANGTTDAVKRTAERQLDTVAHSLVGFLEKATGMRREDLGGEHYLSRRCSPFPSQR